MKNYLVLVSMSKPNKATGDKIVSNLRTVCRDAVSPIWVDAAYVGIPVCTDRSAREIWVAAVEGMNEESDLRDMLVVELGLDWLARKDARATHWLATHLGPPAPAYPKR